MKRIGAWVKTDIRSDGRRRDETLVKAGTHLVDETALSEVGEELGAMRIDHDPMLPSE